ncbi:glycine cleavage system protein R [Brachybacterium sp.]|uniref:glycine cleavage system protein R n=1 Tax=Brachybacterium sp. TaxID=1891286 RepID=UPI002ECFE938
MTIHEPTTAYVLTAIGDDRPGLVAALAAAVDEHGGNWVDSQLALLAGKFAGIVQVDLPPDRAQSFLDALPALADEVGLSVEATAGVRNADREPPSSALRLHLLGQDRTGMVREVTSALRAQGATIDGLRSWTREAPEGGGMLFEAEAELRLPATAGEDGVREALETIAAELMVDLELDGPE